MLKGLLKYKKGSYRKTFIFIVIISFSVFIHSSIDKDISLILLSLGIFLGTLKQIIMPINLDQNMSSPKKYHISDDDFIRRYHSTNHDNEDNVRQLWIIWVDRVSSFCLTAGVLYSIFTYLN